MSQEKGKANRMVGNGGKSRNSCNGEHRILNSVIIPTEPKQEKPNKSQN